MQMKKLIPSPSRTGRHLQRYNEGLRQVVGCIPYRIQTSSNGAPRTIHRALIEDVQVLLITSQKSSRMMFPKGGWELDEDIELAASRETLEEAGVVGLLGEKLGEWIFKSKSQEKHHQGSMFPLLVTEVLDDWPEKNLRQRLWMNVDEAREACSQPWMREALDAFVCNLQQSMEEDDEEEEPLHTLCRLALCRNDDMKKHIIIGSHCNTDNKDDVDRCLIT